MQGVSVGERMTPAERVARINAEISGVASQYGVTSWELDFLRSVATRPTLTQRQETTLAVIEAKVFEDEE